ncbi:MAG TPA: CBS domain-containing protein [Bdellovibrionales bacterium]|nr:CBS domain-containing protein [Bdellovibrionales bacterium]
MSQTIVGEHMVKFPYTVEPKMTVREAFYLMGEWRIRHLPITENGSLVGIVSERDLRQYFNTAGDMKLSEIMTATPYCVRLGTKLEEVLEAMERKRIGSALVVSRNNEVLGIFTTIDAIKLLRRMLREDPIGPYAKWDVDDVFERWDVQ